MKILIINTTGGYFGGVEQNIALCAKGLRAKGHSCYFACKQLSGIDQAQFDALFEQTWVLDSTSLADIVELIQPDVFYVHKYDTIDEVIDVKGSKRIVRMVHDHDLYCPRKHKYYAFSRKICTHPCGIICYLDLAFIQRGAHGFQFTSIRKKIIEMRKNREVDELLVGSEYMMGELKRNGFAHKQISLLPPSVEPFDSPLQDIPHLPSILFVGQLIKGKGVDVLLEAYVELMKRIHSPISLHIIGRGNEENALKEYVKTHSCKDSITFHGWVAHESLVKYYDNASVVVVPSRWPEPFGMVGVEAMLRERPVIASRVGGIPDWLKHGENGYLVPPNDPKALSESLYSLIKDPKKGKEMGERGRVLATELFSFETYIDTLEHLLEK